MIRLLCALVAAGAAVVVLAGLGAPVAAQPSPSTSVIEPTTTSLPPAEDAGGIIPRPNSGREPESPFDRGGTAQLALLALVLLGLGAIVVLIVRESRRRRAAATPRPGRTSAPGTTPGG